MLIKILICIRARVFKGLLPLLKTTEALFVFSQEAFFGSFSSLKAIFYFVAGDFLRKLFVYASFVLVCCQDFLWKFFVSAGFFSKRFFVILSPETFCLYKFLWNLLYPDAFFFFGFLKPLF